MRILSMTATFGKLEHETLTLEPGLDLIEAPNEWGKSTWCAFLMAMLYGLDTRERTTKTNLAEKERYAPWSGSSMSGRMELEWQGRRITIERRSKGRTPMGEFKAYETDSGLPVPELKASNCGQLLLGVERSVFARSGLLRSTDMPVTMNEELRSRLNALVTTGDDSGMAEELGEKLRELKNRCRYNRSGLIPQAESRRNTLENQLREHEALAEQIRQLEQRQKTLEQEKQLAQEAAAKEDQRKMEEALRQAQQAQQRCQELEAKCAGLPDKETALDPPPAKNTARSLWFLIGGICLAAGIVLPLLGQLWGLTALALAAAAVVAGILSKPKQTVCWQAVLEEWERLEEARQAYRNAQIRIRSLQLREPEDGGYQEQLRQLHLRLGQCQGRMAAIGEPDGIRRELEQVRQRLERLELTEQALILAQQTLAQAREELQRRFAPGISKNAQRIFARLTGGRYDRLTLGQDLSVEAGAQGEDTLRSPLWRSEGTADQLYLALRLAVAEELTPDAPLILDDALIRFDDERLATALDILQELSERKQVIVFSCRKISGTLQRSGV